MPNRPIAGDHKNIRILLVDDFEMIRLMLKNALESLGFMRVDVATNGVEAIQKMRDAKRARDPYAFVFCDWNMPEKDGLEVVKECRASRDLKDIPIVIITAESEQDRVSQALLAGATDYIVKPISPAVLQKKVEKLLSLVKAA
jgi:two-component system, chemotaxis family, chemotaxis protein CheY